MRITEAMFYNICQNALAAGDPAVARLNSAMALRRRDLFRSVAKAVTLAVWHR
jgi:hypothetical protein